MPTFAQAFGLSKSQPELDFVDVSLLRDNRLFLDPFAIAQELDRWSQDAATTVRKQFTRGSDVYSTFKAKQFIADDSSSPLLDLLATKYRTKFSFIEGFTKLHIFVVTLRCDHSCHYCQVSRQTTDKVTYDMRLDTAEQSVELMMKSPARHLTLELQGGEPLLA